MHQPQRTGHHYVLKVPGTGRIWWGLLSGVGLLLVIVLFFIGEKSVFKVSALYREQQQLKIQIAEMKAKNEKMTQQIEDLKYDPMAVERIAREELGMVRKDEIVYRFVPPAPSEQKK